MRVAFYFSYADYLDKTWDGYTMRYGGTGVSGTDKSMVAYAERFASIGYDVVLYHPKCNDTFYNDVKYTYDIENIYDLSLIHI